MGRKRVKQKKCKVDGCENLAVARGLCSMHYSRLRKTGTTDKRERPDICSVEGCGRKHYAKGLCCMHYLRMYRTGSTELQDDKISEEEYVSKTKVQEAEESTEQ